MPPAKSDDGFSLIEVTVAMLVLLVGGLALAGGVAAGARRLAGSQDQLLASQRAAEAAESVFKARDSRTLAWAQVRNVVGAGAGGGIFLDGAQPVRNAGADGLFNTADDGAVADADMTREVEIRDIRANLRQLRVIVRYRTPMGLQNFVLTTFLSSYA